MKCRVAGQRFGRQEAVRSDPESGRKIPLTYFGRLSWGGEQQEQSQQQPAQACRIERRARAWVRSRHRTTRPTNERMTSANSNARRFQGASRCLQKNHRQR